MSQVLIDWLRRRLGPSVECSPENLGRELFDGKLYFKLLRSYDIFNDEYSKTLVTAHNAESAMRNLKQLCFWLKLLGVNHSERIISDVSAGKNSACLQLLFDLYVCLENRETWFCVRKKKAEQMARDPPTDKFNVTSVTMTPDKTEKEEVDESPYAVFLYERRPMVDEYRERLNKILRRCRQDSERRRDILKKLEEEENKKKKEHFICKSLPGPSETDVLQASKEIKDFSYNLSRRKKDEVIECRPEDYISLLKVMRRKADANKLLTGKMHSMLLKDVWAKILEGQEQKFHEEFGAILAKQSQFEKQMCLRLSQIHHQHKIFVDNKRLLQRLAEEHQAAAGYFEETYVVLRREEDEDLKAERMRVQILHRKLYAEKLRLKYERHYRLCHSVVEDIADIAIKKSETEAEQRCPVSKRTMNEWKALFYKSLPVFLFEDEETILAGTLKQPESSISPEEEAVEEEAVEEEIKMGEESDTESSSCTTGEGAKIEDYDYLIQLDSEAVDEVNEQNLNDYLYMLGPWEYELWPDLAESDFEEVQNVLGFVVHRLLEFKYPLPPSPDPADLPEYRTKAILNNLNDQSAIGKLKMLLTKPGVAIIDMPTAMNYCIEEYIKYEDPEEVKEFIEKRAKSAKSSKGKSSKGAKSEKGSPKEKKTKDVKSKKESAKKKGGKKGKEPQEPPFKDAEIQVPSFIDLAAPRVRSPAEVIGQEVVEVLSIGQSPTDILLIKCLIEYVRSLGNINGWVLLNYPTICSQIELLEFSLTGILPPVVCSAAGSDIKLYIDRERNLPLNEELFRLRSSKLVPRTTVRPPTPVFCPYFNKYVRLQTKTQADKEMKLKAAAQAAVVVKDEDFDSEDEVKPNRAILIEDTLPDGFYEGFGAFHNYIYNAFDLQTLKNLARAILGEDSVEETLRVPSIELFGQEILEYFNPKKGKDKSKGKSKDGKKTAASKAKESGGGSKKSKGKGKTKEEVKHVSIIEPVEDIPIEEESPPEERPPSPPQPPPPAKPGDSNWIYSMMDIHNELQFILASFWESTETVYLDCLKQVFFMYRVQNSVVIPYRNYVRTIMEEIVERPDNRQKYVAELQKFLNNIPNELRYKQRVKAELHCRVFELQEKLWEMSDLKKNKSECRRRELISHNWLAVQLTILGNLFILMIQVEVNRFVDSLQLLYDYHISSIGLLPELERLNKIQVPKLPRIQESLKGPENSEQETIRRQSKTKKGSLSKQAVVGQITGSSQKLSSQTLTKSPFDSVMQLLFDAHIDRRLKSSIHTSFSELVDALIDQLINNAKQIKGKAERVLKAPQKKGKKGKNTAVPKSKRKKLENEIPLYVEPQDPRERLFMEWETAVDDETRRVVFRIKLIKKRALEDMSEIQTMMQTNFHGFYNDIVNIYKRDMSNIAALCKLLRTAIEEETPIQPELKLGQEKFRADADSPMFDDPPIPPPTPLLQLEDDYLFTVVQLDNLLMKLKGVSPVGIAKETFLDILEDMKFFGHENGFPYLPKSWSNLDRKDLKFLLDSAFGDVLLIDWRDFLVFALNIPFPTVEEIVEARRNFLERDPERTEVVESDDYESIVLWFEKELGETLEDDLRIALVKRFLFDLYQVDGNQVNYSALLLAFCKDDDPIDGFGKALALASGTGFVLRPELLHLALEETEEERAMREAVTIAEQIENQLLTDAMQYALGVVVKEIEEEETGEEEDLCEEFGQFAEDDYMGGIPEEEENLEEEGGKIRIKWMAVVSYELALSVLAAGLRFYTLSAETADMQDAFETDLLKLFTKNKVETDDGTTSRLMMAHVLARTTFIENLFSRIYVFKTCDVTGLVYNLLVSQYSIDSSNPKKSH